MHGEAILDQIIILLSILVKRNRNKYKIYSKTKFQLVFRWNLILNLRLQQIFINWCQEFAENYLDILFAI